MRKKVGSLVLLIIGSILFGTSCASNLNPNQNINLISQPSGAVVKDNGISIANTPASVQLSKKANHILRFELPGYEPVEVQIDRRINVLYFAQILGGSALIGLSQLIKHGATRGPAIAAEIGFSAGIIIGTAWGFLGGQAYKLAPQTITIELAQIKKDR